MKGRSHSQGIPLLPERARSEGARSTAAVGIALAARPESVTGLRSVATKKVLRMGEERVSAYQLRAGENGPCVEADPGKSIVPGTFLSSS